MSWRSVSTGLSQGVDEIYVGLVKVAGAPGAPAEGWWGCLVGRHELGVTGAQQLFLERLQGESGSSGLMATTVRGCGRMGRPLTKRSGWRA